MKAMHSAPRAQPRSSDDGLIPMINIVFLLLIFFMIAGQIAQQEPNLQLPISQSEQELSPLGVAIHIRADGQVSLGGEAVDGDLEQRLAQSLGDPATPVNCHVHQNLPASVLDPVLNAARRLGVQRLQIVTEGVLP